jgi:uncharacterized membrane protein YphA (DoxX/SURF4 family)
VLRLFSSFAHGAPGAGLLLLRLAAGAVLVSHGIAPLVAGTGLAAAALHLLCAATGALLVVGLWTPLAAAVAAINAVVHALLSPADLDFYLLLATLAAALALLGPGAWSIDARLFGWRRVDIPEVGTRDPGAGHPPLP